MSVATLNRLFQKLGPGIIQRLEYSPTGPPWSCMWRLLLPQGHGEALELQGHGGQLSSKQRAKADAATKLMQSCMHNASILERIEKPIEKPIEKRRIPLQADTECRASKRIKEGVKDNPLSVFNQLCQRNGWDPSWTMYEEGKASFKCTLWVDGVAVSNGCGSGKRAAKQSAAEAALASMAPRVPVVSREKLDPQLIEHLCEAKFKQCMASAGLCHGVLEIELLSKGTVLAGFLMVSIYLHTYNTCCVMCTIPEV